MDGAKEGYRYDQSKAPWPTIRDRAGIVLAETAITADRNF
jgi:hypothetical protein